MGGSWFHVYTNHCTTSLEWFTASGILLFFFCSTIIDNCSPRSTSGCSVHHPYGSYIHHPYGIPLKTSFTSSRTLIPTQLISHLPILDLNDTCLKQLL